MNILIIVISLILAVAIVNTAQQVYMKIMGASAMFYSGKAKLIAIGVLTLIFIGLALKLFGKS